MFRLYPLYNIVFRQYANANIRIVNTRAIAATLFIDRINNINIRNLKTVPVKEQSYVKKFMNAVGLMDKSKIRLKVTGYYIYETIPSKVPYLEWFKYLDLPDTFTSWFAITELHVWMLMVRYMAEDSAGSITEKANYVEGDGHFVKYCIVEAMWTDVGNKIKLLEGANLAIARKQVSTLSSQFQASLIAYDEGLDDDKILAGAIWRRFYSLSHDVKAENIGKIVKFIRHQISELDKIPSEELRWKPDIKWVSIMEP